MTNVNFSSKIDFFEKCEFRAKTLIFTQKSFEFNVLLKNDLNFFWRENSNDFRMCTLKYLGLLLCLLDVIANDVRKL